MLSMVKRVEPEWGTLADEGPLTPAEIEEKAGALLAQMTLREKVGQMVAMLRSFRAGSK